MWNKIPEKVREQKSTNAFLSRMHLIIGRKRGKKLNQRTLQKRHRTMRHEESGAPDQERRPGKNRSAHTKKTLRCPRHAGVIVYLGELHSHLIYSTAADPIHINSPGTSKNNSITLKILSEPPQVSLRRHTKLHQILVLFFWSTKTCSFFSPGL